MWKSEWPGESYWTEGKVDSAGLGLLFNKKLNVQILDDDPDVHNRILRLTVKIEEHTIQLVNIYGYNSQNEKESQYFFQRIQNHIAPDENVILLGDFNMVEDVYLYRNGGNKRNMHTYGLEALNELKEDYNFVEIWRERNPDKKKVHLAK